jgi:hypothetical protein
MILKIFFKIGPLYKILSNLGIHKQISNPKKRGEAETEGCRVNSIGLWSHIQN